MSGKKPKRPASGEATDETRRQPPRATPPEMAARRQYVHNGLISGVPHRTLKESIVKKYGVAESTAHNYIREALTVQKSDFEQGRVFFKSEQLDRVRVDIYKAQQANDLTNLAKFENLFADVAGTKEPIRVQVDVRHQIHQAFARIAAEMTPEEVGELEEEQRRNVLMVKRAKALLAERGEVLEIIDAEVEASREYEGEG